MSDFFVRRKDASLLKFRLEIFIFNGKNLDAFFRVTLKTRTVMGVFEVEYFHLASSKYSALLTPAHYYSEGKKGDLNSGKSGARKSRSLFYRIFAHGVKSGS